MRADRDDRQEGTGTPPRRPLLFVLLAVGVLGALVLGLMMVLRSTEPTRQPVTLAPPSGLNQAATTTPAQSPEPAPASQDLSEAPTDRVVHEPPLPALEHSDPEVRATLSDVLPTLAQASLGPDELLRRAAVCTANFARGKLVRDKLPMPATSGRLTVTRRDDRIYLAEANFARYDALANGVAELDADAFARWLSRYEPLLAEAWKELAADGNPRQALIAGLEVLIAAPDLQGDIELVQPSVFYKFADPALEALPDSQKLMIRIGPANRELVREKARRLRDALAAQRAD